jgi:hypothetical protein
MKLPLLALLCAGTAAYCQSPASPQVDPDKLFQMPEKFTQQFTQQAPDFKTFQALPPMTNELLLGHLPIEAPGLKLNDPRIDPDIILHPPWPDKGEASKGRDVSRNLFPHLRFLPIHHGRPIR